MAQRDSLQVLPHTHRRHLLIKIPPIPKKKASKRTTRDLVKRMHILTFFLNDLAARPEMFASKFVQGFMSMTEE